MSIKHWIRFKDWRRLAQALQKRHPQGMPGEHGELAAHLIQQDDVASSDAQQATDALEASGYAHHLPGAPSHWVFTSRPVSITELMSKLDEEYGTFVGPHNEPREEMLSFISSRLGVDKEVANEILTGLEGAGYSSMAYDPDYQRGRLMIDVPKVS